RRAVLRIEFGSRAGPRRSGSEGGMSGREGGRRRTKEPLVHIGNPGPEGGSFMRRSAWPIISFLWLPALLIVIPALSGVAEAQRTPTISNPTPLSNPTAYWTPATMAAAVPMDLVRPGAPTPASAPASLAPGPPGGAGGSLPGEEVNVGPGLRPELSGTGPTPADGSYPGPHDTYEYG